MGTMGLGEGEDEAASAENHVLGSLTQTMYRSPLH